MGRNAMKRIHISKILPNNTGEEPDEDLLPEDRLSQYWVEPTKENELKFNVKGSEANRKKLLQILDSYKDIFATELTSAKPARVTPMKMEVDYEAFKADKRSREPTRPQSAARQEAIAKWLAKAVRDKIIRPSTAVAWAQLMLTPKPNGSWRFAIDYRPINKYTKPTRAPIPHIKRLLNKIGAHKPKFFAKMDLTSGFYQTPLDEESMKYTAFDTDLGLFEFTRASMGLLNSPWYFQSIMEREVFPTLIHRIMEIYIDDLLTWAKDIDELCENLKKIFQSLRDKGMTLNPDKCEFGLS
jgi:hypothetical protein